MPMYDFHCKDCEAEFIVMTTLAKRDEPQECPSCGSENTERTVSLPGNVSASGFGFGSSGGCGGGGFT